MSAGTGDERGDAAWSADVRVPLAADYPGFAGHFPGDPVLPGMCHVLLCRDAASRLAGERLELAEVRRARFRRKVAPGEDLRIRLRGERLADRAVEVRAVHLVGGEEAAELHLLLRPASARAASLTRGE
jgi:3-hydroxyacyl-[acyl-carrier-protein] dehydratase